MRTHSTRSCTISFTALHVTKVDTVMRSPHAASGDGNAEPRRGITRTGPECKVLWAAREAGGRLSAADSVGVSGSGARRGASIGWGHKMRRENPQWEGGLLFYCSFPTFSVYYMYICMAGCARSGFYERLGSRGAAVAVYFPLNTLL